jgi:hypothetical protein
MQPAEVWMLSSCLLLLLLLYSLLLSLLCALSCCNWIYAFEKGMMWTQKERNLISLEDKLNILLHTDKAMCTCISLVKQFGFWVTTLNIIVKRLSCLEDNDNKCEQPPAQWLLRLFPLGKNRWGMKQTTHLHLQPRYRMQGTTLSTPSCA